MAIRETVGFGLIVHRPRSDRTHASSGTIPQESCDAISDVSGIFFDQKINKLI